MTSFDAQPVRIDAGAQPHRVPTPALAAERIAAIDTLRGVALLGILAMNIGSFAFIGAAYMNPTVQGGFTGADKTAWWLTHLVFDHKMMSIFSMLFGAGLLVMTSRAEARDARHRSAGLHYRRMFWLLLIGMAHAYGLWYGDILVTYALCGMIVFLMRRWQAGTLIAVGAALLLVFTPIWMAMGFVIGWLQSSAQEAQRLLDAGSTLTADQQAMLDGWHEARASFNPTAEQVAEQTRPWLGSYAEVSAENRTNALYMQTQLLLTWGIWRASGLMLIGMGLFKLGVLSAQRSTRFYAAMAAIGYLVGLPIVALGATRLIGSGFEPVQMFMFDWNFNYYGSVFVALGHIALVMLIVKLGVLAWLASAFAAVGRMALTNYLMQTVISTFVFHGWGLGMFASFSRAELWAYVVAVWIAQLIISPLWLSKFRFGPAEWAWRSLTYWKLQPMLRTAASGHEPGGHA